MNPNILASLLTAMGKESYPLEDKELCEVLRDVQKGNPSVKWFLPAQEDIIFPSHNSYLRSPLRIKHLREEQSLDRSASNEKRQIATETLSIEKEAYQALIKAGFPSNLASTLCKDAKSMTTFRELLKAKT